MSYEQYQIYPYLLDNCIYLCDDSFKYFLFGSQILNTIPLQKFFLDHDFIIDLCTIHEPLHYHLDSLKLLDKRLETVPFNKISISNEYLFEIFKIYYDIAVHIPQYKHFIFQAYQREIAFVYYISYYRYEINLDNEESYHFLCYQVMYNILNSTNLLLSNNGDNETLNFFFDYWKNPDLLNQTITESLELDQVLIQPTISKLEYYPTLLDLIRDRFYNRPVVSDFEINFILLETEQ